MKIFLYTYFGFFLSSVPSHMIGAAVAAMAPAIPSWNEAFEHGENVGGLFGATLAPVGGFGKFLMVLVALSTLTDCALCMYTFGNSFMAILPPFARVPRYAYSIVSTAILIPVAIVGQAKFYSTLLNIISLIGYWSTVFAGIVLIEHFVFRRGDWTQYNIHDWNKPRRLPPGFAALLAFACAIGIIVPCMEQVYYVGPISRAGAGDVGLITGVVVGGLAYLPLRWLERRFMERRGD